MQFALRLKDVDPENSVAVSPNSLQHIAFGRVGQTLIDLVQPSQIKIACPAKTASPEVAKLSKSSMLPPWFVAPRRTDHLTIKLGRLLSAVRQLPAWFF